MAISKFKALDLEHICVTADLHEGCIFTTAFTASQKIRTKWELFTSQKSNYLFCRWCFFKCIFVLKLFCIPIIINCDYYIFSWILENHCKTTTIVFLFFVFFKGDILWKTHFLSAHAHTFLYLECIPTHKLEYKTTQSVSYGLPISENMFFNKLLRFGSLFYIRRGAH